MAEESNKKIWPRQSDDPAYQELLKGRDTGILRGLIARSGGMLTGTQPNHFEEQDEVDIIEPNQDSEAKFISASLRLIRRRRQMIE